MTDDVEWNPSTMILTMVRHFKMPQTMPFIMDTLISTRSIYTTPLTSTTQVMSQTPLMQLTSSISMAWLVNCWIYDILAILVLYMASI
jgi:hypothetical protein